MSTTTVATIAALLLGAAAVLGAAIAFGGPEQPAPMASINQPFRTLDTAGAPPLRSVTARDGTALAWRAYDSATQPPRGSVVLVHGSSASSLSLHALARAFAAAGYTAYALDIRGHGESGTRGRIDYLGQLDDDLEDFMRSVQPARPATLAGFSSGGGFALRIAGGRRQAMFDQYLLLSPFIGQDAPTHRPDSGGWVSVGVPRLVAIGLLDAIGVHLFDDLPVTRFALDDAARERLTPAYSYALAQNFRPPRDYRATIRGAMQPMRLLAGGDDEAFDASRFAEVFAAEGKAVPVTLLPGIGHIALSLQPAALRAAVQAVEQMNAATRAGTP